MKTPLVLILGIILLSAGHGWADVLDEGQHPVRGCTKVMNSNAYPNAVFIGHLIGAREELYLIEQGKCLRSGFDSQTVEIFSIDRDHFYALGIKSLQSKELLKDSSVVASAVKIENPKRAVWKIDPLIEEYIEYSVVATKDKQTVLYKSKKISVFNNRRTDNVELFEKPL